MSLVGKGIITLGIILFSAAAVAYESEREYLLDLYYGVDLEANQSQDQTEQNTAENLSSTDAGASALHLTFPIADNNTN